MQVQQVMVNRMQQGQQSFICFLVHFLKGLIKQLKFEGYTGKEAKYAVNHCGASWKKQAVKGAKAYLRSGSFSKKGLIKQLKYEGYTSKEAAYGVKKCGANWKKQAVKSAKAYLRSSSFSRSGLLNQLIYEGYTRSQAQYGVNKAYK